MMAQGRGPRSKKYRARKALIKFLENNPNVYQDVATVLCPMFPDLSDETIVVIIKTLRKKYGLGAYLVKRENGRGKIVGVIFRPGRGYEAEFQSEHKFHTDMGINAVKRVQEISFEAMGVLGYNLGTDEIKRHLA